MIRDFLLGFPPVLAALEAMHQQPTPAQPVVPQRVPLDRSAEQDDADTEKWERDHPPAIPVLQYREPRYIPEWERPVEVVFRIDLGGGDETVVTTLAPAAEAPTEWQSGPPPSIGWWPAETCGEKADVFARYFDGAGWSGCVNRHSIDFADRVQELEYGCKQTRLATIEWRGPRLTGADWPEPPAQAEEVPSATVTDSALRLAQYNAWLHDRELWRAAYLDNGLNPDNLDQPAEALKVAPSRRSRLYHRLLQIAADALR